MNCNRRTDLPVLLLHNLDDSWEPREHDQALDEIEVLETAIRREGHPVTNVPVQDADVTTRLRDYNPDEYIVLNCCEGLPGLPWSEAMVAESLESLKFTYTGSPPDVLSTSWDKGKVKEMLDRFGVPTPSWRLFDCPSADGWDRFPAIVKPSKEHCSSGLTTDAVVLTRGELRDRIAYVLDHFNQPALVEDFIDGREFHVSLWGDEPIEMLAPAEMDFSAFENVRDRLCTFESKFKPGSRHYNQIRLRLPAPLREEECGLLDRTAKRAYRIMGCRDYARLDIRQRHGIFYVLDVNPNPDISSDTSMASAAELAGYSYGAMVSRMVNLAARRHSLFGAEAPP